MFYQQLQELPLDIEQDPKLGGKEFSFSLPIANLWQVALYRGLMFYTDL